MATDKEEITIGLGGIISIPAGEKHWHGAAKGATFSHIYVMPPGQKTTQLEDYNLLVLKGGNYGSIN